MKLCYILLAVTVIIFSASAQATDPRIQYSTYLGGSKLTCANPGGIPCTQPPAPASSAKAVAVDSAGNIYVVGTTNESDFPITTGSKEVPVECDYSSNDEPCYPTSDFLVKFSPQGKLLYSTLLPLLRQGNALAIDGAGNAYVVGDGNLRGVSYRAYSAWVMKFSPSGTLIYSYSPDIDADTQSMGTDSAVGIALNANATAAYVVGVSNSGFGDIQTTPGAYKQTFNPNDYTTTWVVKVNIASSTSASLVYGTYIGTAYPTGIGVDAGGNAYFVGATFNDFAAYPTTATAYQKTVGGGFSDAFVTKLNSTGSALIYSTLLGGLGDDGATGMRLDSSGNVIVTASSNFPHSASFGSGAPTSFVTKLNAAGSALTYSTLIQGGAVAGIGLDSAGNSYMAGQTGSTSFPKAIPLQASLNGPTDAFFTNLSASGTGLLTSSYLGGSGSDNATAIFVDKAWNAYIVGNTTSTNFPVTTNAYQNTRRGSQAIFLTKIIIEGDLSLTASPKPVPVPHGANLTYSYAVTNKGPDNSDGDTLTTAIPAGTTFVGFNTTNGSCTHPATGATGTFTCTRTGLLLPAHSWGPITLTVKVNAAAGSTLTNTARVTAKTQDVVSSNNTATTTVKVQ